MITEITLKTKSPIRESKIIHKRAKLHPLAGFVTEEAVALKFNVKIEEIHRIELWDKLVYVYAGKLSRFVSYADFPPVVRDSLPNTLQKVMWRERIYNIKDQAKKTHLFTWWCQFYGDRLSESKNEVELRKWGEILAILKPFVPENMINTLREIYRLILNQHRLING
jgi:hypothetical protein